MRKPRLKPLGVPMFYHLYNRVAGIPGFFPFGLKEKEHFIGILHRLSKFYTVKIVSYQVMSNHFHLVVYAPDETPSPEEVCARYYDYYEGRRVLDPSDPFCGELALRMRDISWFMHALQQQFSTWYNRTRSTRRRGSLWAERFKHTLLGDAQAVWECCKYIEMNPVRAGIVSDPAEYRFSSYGSWCGRGRHPFEDNIREVLLPWLAGMYPFPNAGRLRDAMSDAFAETSGLSREETDGRALQFRLQLDRRLRYWVDGLVIGSELFIHEMISRHAYILRSRGRRLTRARGPDQILLPLCCYKQLRAL